MADFLVLEEDGTSKVELEESALDFLLLEESGFVPPRPSYATWRTGVINVSGSAGSVSVTGLGGTPAAVFFFGTNFTTEDTVDTAAHRAIFRGMAAPKWDDPGTIVQNAACVMPAGDAHHESQSAVANVLDQTGALTFSYFASMSSFDADGFTVSFGSGGTGLKLVWVALMDVANVGGYAGGGTTFSLGWKAGACLLHGAWNGPDVGLGDRTQEFYGGAAYPGTGGGGTWFGAGHSAYVFPTSTGQQRNLALDNFAPETAVTEGGEFIGPSLTTSLVTAHPSGGSLTDFAVDFTNNNGGMVVVWDDEDSQTGRVSTPAQTMGSTFTVSGLPFRPGLVIGYSLSDEPPGQSSFTGVRGATGFSVATEDFQWSALVDGSDQGAFQSFQRGFTDTVHNSDVHAGTIQMTDDGFVLTTEEDTATAHDWVWHAFGHPRRTGTWIPQLVRYLQ